MQDYFRCEDGYEAHAQLNAHRACKKLVHDMHYEVRIQAIINYYATEENKKVTKAEARLMTLTKEQFLKVTNKHQDSSFLIISMLHLIFYLYFMTCRCLLIGAIITLRPGKKWWTSGSLPSGWRSTKLLGTNV